MNMNINPMMQEALRRLQSDPREFIKRARVNIPDEIVGDPKEMVMHLFRTGQVKNPMIQQMMQQMFQGMGMK